MLGIALFFIGGLLVVNGVGMTGRIEARETAFLNFLVGITALFINFIGIIRSSDAAGYMGAAAGLLFAFTYLYLALVQWKGLNGKGLGWYCLFVAVNTLPLAWLASEADIRVTAMWLAWGVLWFLFFLALGLGKKVYGLAPLTILIGIFSGWLPGFLMLVNRW